MIKKSRIKKSALGLFLAATCMSTSVMPALAADDVTTVTATENTATAETTNCNSGEGI